jgi:hypothetical protein
MAGVFKEENTDRFDDKHEGYKQWLKDTDTVDTQVARDWYNCKPEKAYQFMKDHKAFFRN